MDYRLEGVLVYDLDEAMDFELLDGQNGNIPTAFRSSTCGR
ncbi:MAG: hypothetical protein V8R91_01420 [Butyricimonas faecihominis]